ncbi:MAG: TrmH family RNA methyltransferase [Pseudomonadota bacterium]
MVKDTIRPAIILVRPQLGENIGSTARVMLNFGLVDLRIVRPRDGWPSLPAAKLSAGAFEAGVSGRIYDRVEEAISDLSHVYAATARPREMEKPVVDAPKAVQDITSRMGTQSQSGILFGSESSGLTNHDVTFADTILTYPVNSDFASLNLAMAVGVFASAWGQTANERPEGFETGSEAAPREELIGMFKHLEQELGRAGYFHPPEKTPVMVQNLRAAFIRGEWTSQEIQTFRGAIKALALGRGKARIERE